MHINALLSDSQEYVLVFYNGQDEPEEYTASEFIECFGEEAFNKLKEGYEQAHQTLPDAHEIAVYYDALKAFLVVDGKYVSSIKMRSNAINGSEHVGKVIDEYFKSDLEKLTDRLNELKEKRTTALENLDFWHERVGLGPLPCKANVTSPNRLTIERLANLFWCKCTVRERMVEKARKHQKDGELYSLEELTRETLLSFRKIQPYEEATTTGLIKLAHEVL